MNSNGDNADTMNNGLEMTAEEFSRLPTKQQLTVLYRHIVVDRESNRSEAKEIQKLRWMLKWLAISDAALWAGVVLLISKLL